MHSYAATRFRLSAFGFRVDSVWFPGRLCVVLRTSKSGLTTSMRSKRVSGVNLDRDLEAESRSLRTAMPVGENVAGRCRVCAG
eukprot:1727339-Rhodomonas_salina.1